MAVDAATGVNLTVFNDVLKEFYIGPIRDQLNSKTVLLKRIARNEEDTSGRIAVVPLRVSRNEGHGAIAEGGLLADPQAQGWDRAEIPMRFMYGRILVNGPTMAASRNERGSFTQALEAEIFNLVTDMKNEQNRMLWGDGAGRLCQINGAPGGGGTTFVCDNPFGVDNDGPGTRYIRPGMVIGMISGAGVFRGTTTVATVTAPSAFTTSPALATAADNDFVFRASESGFPAAASALQLLSHAHLREMMGLLGIINDANPPAGPLHNIAATAPWIASVFDNATIRRPIDLDLMQQAIDAADIAGDGKITLIGTSYNLHRKYLDLLVAEKRYVNNLKLDGGFSALEYNMIPVVPDKDAVPNRMFFIDEDTLAIYRWSDYFWLNKDGSVLARLDNKDAYQATLALYAEMGTSSRNRHSLIEDLDES